MALPVDHVAIQAAHDQKVMENMRASSQLQAEVIMNTPQEVAEEVKQEE